MSGAEVPERLKIEETAKKIFSCSARIRVALYKSSRNCCPSTAFVSVHVLQVRQMWHSVTRNQVNGVRNHR